MGGSSKLDKLKAMQKEGKKGILRKESSQASQASSASSEGSHSQGQGQGQKSLYSIAILDSIDTLETLDHLAIPPMLYHQLRRLNDCHRSTG